MCTGQEINAQPFCPCMAERRRWKPFFAGWGELQTCSRCGLRTTARQMWNGTFLTSRRVRRSWLLAELLQGVRGIRRSLKKTSQRSRGRQGKLASTVSIKHWKVAGAKDWEAWSWNRPGCLVSPAPTKRKRFRRLLIDVRTLDSPC